jgi:cytochrome c oxidase subunit 1
MEPWLDLNKFISMSAILGGVAQFVFLYNFFNSIFRGKKSGQNPWKANSLEWTAPMDVRLHGNWPGEIPHVYRWPYDYSVPGAPDDFIPQNVSDEDLPEEARTANRENTLAAEADKAEAAKKEETTVMFSSLISRLGFRKG